MYNTANRAPRGVRPERTFATMSLRCVSQIAIASAVLSIGLMAGQPNTTGQDPEKPNRFTNTARIPAGADTNTIRFEKARRIEVHDGSPTTVYEVTYSYTAQPLASDERGDGHFTFKVYFPEDKLTPEMQEALAARKAKRADYASCFAVSTKEEEKDSDYITVKVEPVPGRLPRSGGVSASRTQAERKH